VADAAPSDLARDLIIARNDNIAHRDLINNLSRTDILQIDDFLAVGIDERAASDLFAILANRDNHKPTIIASQSNPKYWLQALPDRVLADSIVNRLANNARKINLGDTDMRQQRNQHARSKSDYWE